MTRSFTTLLWLLAGVLALTTVLTVAIHLGPVRTLLGWKPLGAGDSISAFCPFGDGGEPAHIAAAPGQIPTSDRPALGFALGVTTRSDVDRWATEHQIRCKAQRRGAIVECTDVPAELVAGAALAATSLWFRFDDGSLAGIQTVRRTPVVGDVVAAFHAVETSMTSVVGPPSRHDGVAIEDSLSRGALRQATVEYTAPSYRAVVRATNMGNGYVLTESYAN